MWMVMKNFINNWGRCSYAPHSPTMENFERYFRITSYRFTKKYGTYVFKNILGMVLQEIEVVFQLKTTGVARMHKVF